MKSVSLKHFLSVGFAGMMFWIASPMVFAQQFYTSVPTNSGPGTGSATAPNIANTSSAPASSSDSASGSSGSTTSRGSDRGGLLSSGIFSPSRFRYSVAVREGYNDNLFQTRTNTNASFYTNFGAGIGYSLNTPRLQLTSLLNGGVTYYYTRPGNQLDWTGSFVLNALYKASARLLLTFNTQTAYLSQPDLNVPGTSAQQNGDYIYSSTSLSATYQWSRKISTVTSYNVSTVYYLDQGLNETQGYISQTLGQQLRWLVLPKTNAVAEYRINPITYFYADQDSLGNFFLLGFDQIFNPRSTWNVRAGAQVNFLNNATSGQSTYIGPYAESIFTYQFAQKSYISWNLRYGTEPSGLNDITQRQTFRTGLSITHAFTARITGTVSGSYLNNYYDQPGVVNDFYENIFQAYAGLAYRVNRVWSLEAGYQYTQDISQMQSREYLQNVVYIGTSLNF